MGFHGGPGGPRGGGGGFRGGGGGRFSRREEEKEERERKVSDTVLLKRLMTYLAPHKHRMVTLMALMLGALAISLITPLLTKYVLDGIINPGMETGDMSPLNLWLLAMAAITLVQFGVSYGRSYLIGWIGNKVVYQVREDMVLQLQSMSLRYFAEGETGRIMSRVSNDADTLSNFIGGQLVEVVSDVIAVVGALFLMFSLSVELTLLSFAVIPVMFLLPFLMRTYMRRAWRQTRVTLAGMTSAVQESVSGMRVVQSFTQEDRDIEVFDTASQATVRARLRATLVGGIFGISVGLAQVAGTVALLWYGAIQIVSGNVTFGTFVAFQQLLMSFFRPLMTIANFYNDFQEAMAGAERVFEILDTEEEVKEAPEEQREELKDVKGEIIYDHVTFEYDPGIPVLKDINLVIQPNQKVAFVGPTGAGKTTMTKLFVRFYDPQEGAITLDGHDIKKLSLSSLRSRMSIVPQDTFLFQGTVKENIKYGKLDATDEEMIEAAKAVNAHEFIERLPEGYDTVIMEGSTNISIGQRQLITFARALLVDPKILILDEATSSVDPYTELIIQKGLEKLMENRTAIIIAHRLSTVRNADKIVVIDNGEIVEMGKHEELLEKGGLYSVLYMRQFIEEEPEEEKRLERPAAPPRMPEGMTRASGTGGSPTGPMDPRSGAVREKMQELRALLQEKEEKGYDVREFKDLAQSIFGAMRGGDAENASKRLDEAIERLKNLSKS